MSTDLCSILGRLVVIALKGHVVASWLLWSLCFCMDIILSHSLSCSIITSSFPNTDIHYNYIIVLGYIATNFHYVSIGTQTPHISDYYVHVSCLCAQFWPSWMLTSLTTGKGMAMLFGCFLLELYHLAGFIYCSAGKLRQYLHVIPVLIV